jgi:hypothetical protein
MNPQFPLWPLRPEPTLKKVLDSRSNDLSCGTNNDAGYDQFNHRTHQLFRIEQPRPEMPI